MKITLIICFTIVYIIHIICNTYIKHSKFDLDIKNIKLILEDIEKELKNYKNYFNEK